MADRVLVGEPPPANAKLYQPGTLWMQVVERAADATGKTVGVSVWSTALPNQIAYNLAGPGTNQPGGPWLAEFNPPAFTVDPLGDGSPGRVDHDFVVPDQNFYQFYAHGSEVDLRLRAQVGPIDEGQTGKYRDPEALAKLTPAGRQAEIRKTAGNIARGATSRLG